MDSTNTTNHDYQQNNGKTLDKIKMKNLDGCSIHAVYTFTKDYLTYHYNNKRTIPLFTLRDYENYLYLIGIVH